MWDSAFARFWRILRGGLAHYRLDKSLRHRLESPQNHRQILPLVFWKNGCSCGENPLCLVFQNCRLCGYLLGVVFLRASLWCPICGGVGGYLVARVLGVCLGVLGLILSLFIPVAVFEVLLRFCGVG